MLHRIFPLAVFVFLVADLLMIFVFSPAEVTQGYVQKIMYLHVPSVWLTFLAFFLCFLASIGYLWKREEKFDVLAQSAAEIGVLFCAIGLLTGSIWGKPTWNTYWTWDARLTTTLILLLVFIGYLLLRKFVDPGEQQARYAAVVGIIGFLDVPLIHQSVVWWRTLHQTSTMFSMKKERVVDPNIAIMLWISVAAFTLFFCWMLVKRVRLENARRAFLRKMANLESF